MRGKNAIIAAAVAACVVSLCACEPKVIPGTQIKDSPDARAIGKLVMERYRNAMEARDTATILSMASPRFYETTGTPSPADDYNYDGLKKKIEDKFKKILALNLDLALQDIVVEKEKGTAFVRYHYFLRYLVKYPSEERWETQSEDAQMNFVLENGEWKVINGL
ncbi:MAG: DUF4440 domain-containing protein [Myxococcota bacterium]